MRRETKYMIRKHLIKLLQGVRGGTIFNVLARQYAILFYNEILALRNHYSAK